MSAVAGGIREGDTNSSQEHIAHKSKCSIDTTTAAVAAASTGSLSSSSSSATAAAASDQQPQQQRHYFLRLRPNRLPSNRRVRNSPNALQQVENSRFHDHQYRPLVVLVSFLTRLPNRFILLDYHGYFPFQRQEPPGVVPVDQELHAGWRRRRYPSAPD